MWRSLLRRAAASATKPPPQLSTATAFPTTTITPPPPVTAGLAQLVLSRSYASKQKNSSSKKDKPSKSKSMSKSKADGKTKPKGRPKLDDASVAVEESVPDIGGDDVRIRALAADESDKSLDVGPDARPLFTAAASLSELTRRATCTYMKFRHVVDPTLQSSAKKGPKVRKQIVLDGPVSCGKSIALAMLVHWARDQDWLVLYVPKGREWTHGGFFYKNPQTGFWDTPDFVKYNKSRLCQLPCHIYDPIPLGEGAGVGWMKDADTMAMPEGSTLYDLVQTGITHTHAAVGVVVRLRKELALVKDIPVLIAIDQYNNWFTFSEYEEPVTVRSCRPIHAKELATVNAFRSMMHDNMMVGAFSHSTAVGKLRKELPDVPVDARIDFPRYNLDEAATVCHYYLRQRLIRREAFSEDGWKRIYYLSNGNGAEMRWLVPFIR
ncbi:hypothetical protein RJ640_025182 [Escallonia rubra]|uniref:Small ribosomal subunit protein mS29 n=1 Tax=Escallonia rubra TaxID=112253 RepID=A0AA88RNY1_9ASTE|nr:hypothetical protein RJ640_025182 [Escallonia rubra]